MNEIEHALSAAPRWCVSASGGKDSTVLLHLVLSLTQTIDVEHGEDEIVAPGTDEYITSLRTWPGVVLTRTACPLRHSDECVSWGEPPYVRPLPADALWFPSRAARLRYYASRWDGHFIGTRREESGQRELLYRRRGALYYGTTRQQWTATPLHDWKLADVWAYLFAHDVPYHPAYDQMTAAGVPHDEQRIGPTGDYRAIGYGSFAWLRMTWPDEFLRIAQRHPWVRLCA